MNTLDKLNALAANCCAVYLEANDHRAIYETVQSQPERAAGGIQEDINRWREANPEEWARMVASDTMVTLQVYPSTPIGFEFFCGESIESVVNQAWERLAAPSDVEAEDISDSSSPFKKSRPREES